MELTHNISTCKECGCRTGGGDYCFAHKPYMVYPLKDGSFRVHRNGVKRIWLDEPPTLETEGIKEDELKE